jgi:hypothetical protein
MTRRDERLRLGTFEPDGRDSDEFAFDKGDAIMSVVPLEVTEEAAAHIAKLGMQPELEQMLDWVRRHVTALQEIRVAMSRRLGYYGKLPPRVYIWAHQAKPAENAPVDLVEWEWAGWKAQTFPPQVCTSFTLFCTYQPLASLPI